MDRPKMLYTGKSIETEPLQREILVHTAMNYKCEVCGKVFRFWLEKGLEDRKQDEMSPQSHKPVPFCIGCLCGGTAQHFAWGSDIRLDDYRPLKEEENYFENTEHEDCGVSHFRNDGTERIARPKLPNLENIFGEIQDKNDKDLDFFETEEDEPYGLAHISTTTLKAELRRRKRWK